MKYVMCIVFCCLLCLGKAQQRVTGQKPGITAPPLELKLNPFYKKYLSQRDSYYSFLAGSRFGDVCGSPYVDGVDRDICLPGC